MTGIAGTYTNKSEPQPQGCGGALGKHPPVRVDGQRTRKKAEGNAQA
ncbi:MAG: hypothetical protein LC102_11655 [Ignavibacteriales bacterium]|nr:hypothetical protein [Ignavibacteriales bacterium]